MSFLDSNNQGSPAGSSIMSGQFQTLLRSLFNKPLTGQEEQAAGQTGQQPLTGGQGGGNPQQGGAGKGGTTQYSALGTAAEVAAPALKGVLQTLLHDGGNPQPQDAGPNDPNVAGGPDEADMGTDASADVAGGDTGGDQIAPADSGSMSASFFSGLSGG